MEQFNEVPDFVIFLGRFHPLLVHLPIGMLLIGILLHFFSLKKKFRFLKRSVPFVFGIGALSAVVACILGYLLSFQGGYDEEALSNHQWMGIIVTIIAIVTYIFSVWKQTRRKLILNSTLMGLIFIGLGFTGHLGGNLTHGSTYLTQYAPSPVRKVMGLAPKAERRPIVEVLDSADIFLDVVQPIIVNKCASCHNNEKSKGGLLLLTYTDLITGGENGPSIVAGDLENSELFKRITLPENHEEFMPPEGKRPFTENSVKLIQFWIENGAQEEGLLAALDLKDEEAELFGEYLGIDGANSNILNALVKPADSIVVASLIANGFTINTISSTSNLLDVKISTKNKLASAHINELIQLKNQIVYLDAGNIDLNDDDLKAIGSLEMLIRLRINSNPITSKGVAQLQSLPILESLNLYGTLVDKEVMNSLKSLQNLKKVFLWNSKIVEEDVAELQESKPELSIVFGY